MYIHTYIYTLIYLYIYIYTFENTHFDSLLKWSELWNRSRMNLGILWFRSPGDTFHGTETSEDDSDQNWKLPTHQKLLPLHRFRICEHPRSDNWTVLWMTREKHGDWKAQGVATLLSWILCNWCTFIHLQVVRALGTKSSTDCRDLVTGKLTHSFCQLQNPAYHLSPMETG